jgi:protein SCO1/2
VISGLTGRVQRAALLALVIVWAGASVSQAQRHAAKGIVTGLDANKRTLVVSCEAIAGYMDAMEMSFAVRDAKVLQSIRLGMTVRFNMVEENHVLYADHLEAGTAKDYGAEPMQAGGLTAVEAAMNPANAASIVQSGHSVPDFELTDQAGKSVHLSDLRGKVVVLTFGYSRCPFPDYCLRLSNNLSAVEKRFKARAGRDLALITVAIDPEHDQGKVLSEYAASFNADPTDWHFLTGPLPMVKQVAALFGMNFWSNEGFLTHSLHTAVIDRDGILVANIEGNLFSAQQLGDLVQKVMDRPQ